MIKSINEGFDRLLNETSCKESDTRRFDRRDELGDDVAKYQRWVDYDMKRFGRISKRTTDTLHKAGLDIVKDQYGDYEVISKSPITEGKRYGQKNFYFETSDGTYSFYCSTEDTRYGFRHLCDVFKLGEHVGEAVARYYNRTWESYQYESVLLKAVDSIVGISDEARGQLIDKIEHREDVREEKCDEDIDKKGEKDIIAWWEDVEKWNSENGSPFNVDNDKFDIEGMHSAMFDMLRELKDKAEDLYKRGKKIYNRYAFSKINESEDDGDIPDDEYYAELEAHIKRIPSYEDDDLKAEYKEFKDSTHEDDKRVEDALFAEMKKRGFVEGLEEGKTLTEGTSNFWSMNELPLLIFDDYESVDDQIYRDAEYELEEQGIGVDDNSFEEKRDELVEKKWDEIDYCTLDEDEQENLKDDIKEFNRRMRYDYDEVYDDLVEIKPGYYQAAQLYCNDRDLDDDVLSEVKKFFDEMKKKYYLTELSVSWRASNGETGYKIVEGNSSEKQLIDAVQWQYGLTKKEAINYIKTISDKAKEALVSGYLENCKKNFYSD